MINACNTVDPASDLPGVDRFSYTIERARLRVLKEELEKASKDGDMTRWQDLYRMVRASEKRCQEILLST